MKTLVCPSMAWCRFSTGATGHGEQRTNRGIVLPASISIPRMSGRTGLRKNSRSGLGAFHGRQRPADTLFDRQDPDHPAPLSRGGGDPLREVRVPEPEREHQGPSGPWRFAGRPVAGAADARVNYPGVQQRQYRHCHVDGGDRPGLSRDDPDVVVGQRRAAPAYSPAWRRVDPVRERRPLPDRHRHVP